MPHRPPKSASKGSAKGSSKAASSATSSKKYISAEYIDSNEDSSEGEKDDQDAGDRCTYTVVLYRSTV